MLSREFIFIAQEVHNFSDKLTLPLAFYRLQKNSSNSKILECTAFLLHFLQFRGWSRCEGSLLFDDCVRRVNFLHL